MGGLYSKMGCNESGLWWVDFGRRPWQDRKMIDQGPTLAARTGFARFRSAAARWLLLFAICGPLNPALLLTGFLSGPDIPFWPTAIPDFSVIALQQRIVFVMGPSVLMALIAIRLLLRPGAMDIRAAWWRGYWMSVLFAPACFGLFIGIFGIATSPTDTLELLLTVPMIMVMGLVVGWLTLIIPFLAVFIGLPAMFFGILATKVCLPGLEHQGRSGVL
jgi:hypothetical protein